MAKRKARTKKTSRVTKRKPTKQSTRAPTILPPLEPDARAKKIAFWSVLTIVLVMGVVGALIELVLGPLIAEPVGKDYAKAPTQQITMVAGNGVYEPNTFRVRTGETVQWTIDATNAANCTSHLLVPDLEINIVLPNEQTTIEFTVFEPAIIPFSCAAATAQGYITVE